MSDEALVDAYCKNGNENCVGELFERYKKRVAGVCMKYLKNKEESEDLTMQIFQRLLQKLPDYNINSFQPWLYRITTNECLSLLKKHSRTGDLYQNWVNDEKKSEEFMENDGLIRLTSELEAKQRSAIIQESLEKLKEHQRICVEAFYLKEMSYRQIADKYEYPISKVKSYIQNGKRSLIKELSTKVILKE